MITRKVFFDGIKRPLFGGAFSSLQVLGIDAILNGWEKYGGTDARWLAYCLATTYHETAKTMQPIEEYGHGRPWQKIYDGRGDVQLTHYENYVKATTRLRQLRIIGPEIDMARNPELALRSDIAVAILIIGCAAGWFTGKKLGDYFNDASDADPVGARRIVNGTDKANIIAHYYDGFYVALKAAAQPATAPQATPAPYSEGPLAALLRFILFIFKRKPKHA
jgi:hypothetical protein